MTAKNIVMASVLAGAALMPGLGMAQTTLNYSHYGPDRGSDAKLLHQFAEDVSTATNGEVQVRITFGGALLSTQETARGVASRVADIGTFIAAYNPKEFANYKVVDLPFAPSDPWVGIHAAMDLVETNKVVSSEFDAMNLKLLANFATGPIIFMCRDKVDTLAAFDGIKMRVQPPHSKQLAEFGAISVSVSTPEIYQSLDKGYISCAQGYITSMDRYKQHEVAKHVLEIDQGQALGYGAVINKEVFESLTSDQQAALVDAGKKLAASYAQTTHANVESERAKLIDNFGVEFLQLSAEEQSELDAAAEVTLEDFNETADPSVFDDFLMIAAKYQAEMDKNGYPGAGSAD